MALPSIEMSICGGQRINKGRSDDQIDGRTQTSRVQMSAIHLRAVVQVEPMLKAVSVSSSAAPTNILWTSSTGRSIRGT